MKFCVVTEKKQQITQKFNGILRQRFLVVLDELGKELTTPELFGLESHIRDKYTIIKQKGKDTSAYTVGTQSFVNFVFTTINKPTFITKSKFGRLYVPIHVSEKYAFNSDYFRSKAEGASKDFWYNINENILSHSSARYFFKYLKSLGGDDLVDITAYVDTPFQRELDECI